MRVDLRAAAAATRSVLLPALCAVCGRVLAGDDRGLCVGCRSQLAPLAESCCPRCGTPADSDNAPCLACLDAPPPQLGTVLWGEYDGILRRAILALKYRGRDEIARPLAARLAARISVTPWLSDVSAVAAVPSHRLRRLRRGPCAANQIAEETARCLDRPVVAALRRHGLERQQGRTRHQRLQLARGSFSARSAVRGKRLLVVDDVSTTGTTLRRAAEALIHGGADAVYCAAMAHAPDPRSL